MSRVDAKALPSASRRASNSAWQQAELMARIAAEDTAPSGWWIVGAAALGLIAWIRLFWAVLT